MLDFIAIATAASVGSTQLAAVVESPDGKPLALQTCGVRHTLWIEHYSAGLYVRTGKDAQAVTDPNEAKAVRLQMIDTRYLPKQIPKKWRRALERALPEEAMGRVNEAYRSLRPGDQVMISYGPTEGVALRVNGKVLARSSGHGVIDAILEEWAERQPTEQKLARLARDHPCRTNPVAVEKRAPQG